MLVLVHFCDLLALGVPLAHVSEIVLVFVPDVVLVRSLELTLILIQELALWAWTLVSVYVLA